MEGCLVSSAFSILVMETPAVRMAARSAGCTWDQKKVPRENRAPSQTGAGLCCEWATHTHLSSGTLEYHLPPRACDNEGQVLPADPKADELLAQQSCVQGGVVIYFKAHLAPVLRRPAGYSNEVTSSFYHDRRSSHTRLSSWSSEPFTFP